MTGKRGRFFDRLERRAPKRRCRRCRRRFTPPPGSGTEVCPPCARASDP